MEKELEVLLLSLRFSYDELIQPRSILHGIRRSLSLCTHFMLKIASNILLPKVAASDEWGLPVQKQHEGNENHPPDMHYTCSLALSP